jgi:hypothetical protein
MNDLTRERLEALYGDRLEPSSWPDEMEWGGYTERDFRLAWAHLEATGERVEFVS